jgi:putative transposase
VHAASNGAYGARRVHAELTLGRGLLVGHNAVEMLMARAGIRGVTGRPRWRSPRPDLIAKDLVDRDFARTGPNQLWVTDITEHPTRQGKVYCAVVPTPTPAGWWAGQSTPRRPPPWSPTR